MSEKRHPLEAFPSAVKYLTLPTTGVEVVIRRLDIDAITADASRTVLNMPAVREVAQAWAAEAAEKTKSDTPTRPQVSLPPEVMLEIDRAARQGMLRAAVLRPTLDELVSLYGGSTETADLGLGPDYGYLLSEVDGFSNTKPGDAQKEQAKSLAPSKRGQPAQPGEGVPGASD